jgi:hypothetical protein
MNLDQGFTWFQACACRSFDWLDASNLVNHGLAPLGWVNDRILDLAQVPIVGAIVPLDLYVALVVVIGLVAAALVVVMVIAVNLAAAIAASVLSEFGQLTQAASTIAHALRDDGWGPLVSGMLAVQMGFVVIAVIVAWRLSRGKQLVLAICGILFLGLGPLLPLADALRELGI